MKSFCTRKLKRTIFTKLFYELSARSTYVKQPVSSSNFFDSTEFKHQIPAGKPNLNKLAYRLSPLPGTGRNDGNREQNTDGTRPIRL